jgi:hypothetical protein
LARYQAVILSKSLKEVQSGASYKQGVKSKAATTIPGPPKVKPYVADVIPENTFKIPKNDVILAPEVYRRDQDLAF